MTLFEAREIFAYWWELPPVHLSVKALIGGFAGKRKPSWRQALGDPRVGSAAMRAHAGDAAAAAGDDRERIIAAPPPGLALQRRPKGAPPRRLAVFDPDELAARSRAAALHRRGIG